MPENQYVSQTSVNSFSVAPEITTSEELQLDLRLVVVKEIERVLVSSRLFSMVDLFDLEQALPSMMTLQEYQVVILWRNTSILNTLQDVLNQYYWDFGGALVPRPLIFARGWTKDQQALLGEISDALNSSEYIQGVFLIGSAT